MELFILGSLLGVYYEIITTSKKDAEDLGVWICLLVFLFLVASSWFGFATSIAADNNSIKKNQAR